jgi:hypothetical protein
MELYFSPSFEKKWLHCNFSEEILDVDNDVLYIAEYIIFFVWSFLFVLDYFVELENTVSYLCKKRVLVTQSAAVMSNFA